MAALVGLASPAFGQGFGYAYELHDLDTGVRGFPGRLDMSVHRFRLIDTGGILGAALGTMGSAQYAGTSKGDDGKYYDHWWVKPVAPVPGGYGRFEFAICGDTEVTEATREVDPLFWEIRFVLGDAGLIGDHVYYQADILDLTYRSLTASTGQRSFGNEQAAIYVGLEMGLQFTPVFAGGFVDYDWLGGLLAAFGDEDHTYEYGLAAGLAAGPGRLTVEHGWLQWTDEEGPLLSERTMSGSFWRFGFTVAN